MDCTNSQRRNLPNRPQMPQPPCMNTNCSYPYGDMQNQMPQPVMNRPPMPPQRGESSGILRYRDMGMEQKPLAMGYVPWQRWNQTYPMDNGFERGTIFPELDLPFVMGRCRG